MSIQLSYSFHHLSYNFLVKSIKGDNSFELKFKKKKVLTIQALTILFGGEEYFSKWVYIKLRIISTIKWV